MKHTEYTRLKLTQELTFEANYSQHSTPCKWFKLTMGNKSTTMSRDELFGLLFLFADEQQQEDLIPIKETKVRSITRLLSFKLKKDKRYLIIFITKNRFGQTNQFQIIAEYDLSLNMYKELGICNISQDW